MRKSMHVLSVGNCVERKGFIYLAQALNIARTRLPISWCHIGNGPELADMQRLFPAMEHYDWVPQVPYGIDTIVVVPSVTDKRGLQEGLGLVAIEALAHGSWLISTLNGGLVDVTDNGLYCDTVPERDPACICWRLEQQCPSYNKRAAAAWVNRVYNRQFIRRKLNHMIEKGVRG